MLAPRSLRRLLTLVVATLAALMAPATAGAAVKLAVYYEPEATGNPTVAQLQSDLDYIFSTYASDPAYYKVNGKPVIYSFADGADNCGMADRWKQASAGRFYVGLKVFSGYKLCASQPDSWHQYGPAVATDRQAGFSYSVSPGFWRADEASARLARDPARFRTNLQSAVAAKDPWIHVTSFNEWGEGTAVEPAGEWASASGNGTYLDILHTELAATTQRRATYFYPWFPETRVGGRTSHWTPSLGNPYDSSDPAIIARQRDLLDYGNFDVALTSWWGQGSKTDTRFPALLSGFRPGSPPPPPPPPAGDTTPPSVPANQRQTGATSSTVTVAWDAATDNVGVDHYLVAHCAPDTNQGCTMANTKTLSATVGPIACNTSFVLWVEAVDAAGNKSNTNGATSLTTKTSACPPPSSSTVILAAGDVHNATGGNVTSPLLANNAHDAVIGLGDLQYESGSLAQYNGAFANNWARTAPNAKMFPAPGNHDGAKGGYCGYFTGKVPNDPCPISPDSARQRYKAVVGGVSIYSMDTGSSSGTGDLTAADKAWLDGMLAADTNTCQIVYMHHPRYSGGSDHGSSGALADDWSMMMNRKVDIVLAGHEHIYERYARMGANGQPDATNGIREFLVGTGGHSHYGLAAALPGVQARNATAFGVLKLTINRTSGAYNWTFLPAGGASFTDSGSDTCR